MHLLTIEEIEKCSAAFVHILFHEVVFSSILFLLFLGPVYLLRNRSPHWQFGLMFLIVLRLVLPTDLSFTFSARNLVNTLPAIQEISAPIKTISTNPDPIRPNPADASGVISEKHERQTETHGIYENSHLPHSKRRIAGSVILMLAWMVGFIFAFILFVRKLTGFYGVMNRALPIKDDQIAFALKYWRKNMKVRRKVYVVCSDEYLSPFTSGIFSPRIFIPLNLVQSKDMDTLNSIIAHEMVHIRRFDDFWIKFQNLLLLIYYFHPVVWYVNDQMNSARENTCDSVVLSKRKLSPEVYGRGIMNVLRANTFGFSGPFPGIVNKRNKIERRINNIMKGAIMKKRNSLSIFLAVALVGIFILPMALDKTGLASGKSSAEEEIIEYRRPLQDGIKIKFDPDIHVVEKLPASIQANKKNPHIKKPQMQKLTFLGSINAERTPGLEYYTGGKPVRAIAAGIVHFIGDGPGASGGFVRMDHDYYDGLKKDFYPGVTWYRRQAYRSTYYHLSKIEVGLHQAVKRGQVIGYGMKYSGDTEEKVKIILEERGNLVNVDEYGQNYGFMSHWDGKTDLEINLEEMNGRLDKQVQILKKLNSFYISKNDDDVFRKLHWIEHVSELSVTFIERYDDYPVMWSILNKLKYLAHLYEKKTEPVSLPVQRCFHQDDPGIL